MIDIGTKEKPLIIENENCPNRHILIKGASGQGKTYLIQKILLSLLNTDINGSVIFDFSGSYTKKKLEAEFMAKVKNKLNFIIPYNEELVFNPFSIGKVCVNDSMVEEKTAIFAQRFSEILKFSFKLTPKQTADCYNVIFNKLDSDGNNCDFVKLYNGLVTIGTDSSCSTAAKLKPIVDMNIFSKSSNATLNWARLIYASHITIFDFSGYPPQIKILLTELLLQDLLNFTSCQGNKENNFYIVLDEAHKLNLKLEIAPVSCIMREGRKFGINAIISTQHFGGIERCIQNTLNQASTKIDFNLCNLHETRELAKEIDLSNYKAWQQKLLSMKKGQAVLRCSGKSTKFITIPKFQ